MIPGIDYIKTVINGILSRIMNISKKVDNAQTAADNAQTAADNAKATADNAKTAADNAKTAADNAQTAADNAQTAADNAQTAADNAKAKADNAYTVASKAVKLVNVTIPKSMVSELVTLLNGLQTGEQGKVTYDGYMFSTVFSTGGNVQAEFSYTVGQTTYYEYMLLNSKNSRDAQGFLCWNYSRTGTDTKIFFIRLGNKVNISYIEATRLA